MYLQIQASASRSEGLPLYGRSLYVTVKLVESRRVEGKPRQFYLGSIAYISVPSTAVAAEVGADFWRQVRSRMKGFGVPPNKQKEFVAQIERLLAAITTAKSDPDLRLRLQTNPNKVLSELRRQSSTIPTDD